MLSAFTQMAVDYNYSVSGQSSLSGGALAAIILLSLIVAVIGIVAMWKIFTKAGKPGWAAIVPVYNSWVLAEVAGKPGWWGLLYLLAFIPVLGYIVVIVVSIIIALGLAKNFGKSQAFGVIGLWLFSIVGYLILAFGDATYKGPHAADPKAVTDTPYPTPPQAPTQTPPQA
jgi:hypothetical protein